MKQFILETITTHGGKMKNIPSISTKRECNKRCNLYRHIPDSICAKCYVSKHVYKKALMQKLLYNHEFYTTYEIQPEDVPFINSKYFRFESFADINNTLQFKNYCTIAAEQLTQYNNNCTFALWTKNPDIIAAAIAEYGDIIPDNMIIGYSALIINQQPDIDKIKNMYPFINFVFTVYTKEYAAEHNININCGSRSCITCLACYTKSDEIKIINELLK